MEPMTLREITEASGGRYFGEEALLDALTGGGCALAALQEAA